MGSIDVSVKHSFAEFPQDWAEFLRVPKGTRVRAVDSDVASLATIADKVFEIDGAISLIMHLEPQRITTPISTYASLKRTVVSRSGI